MSAGKKDTNKKVVLSGKVVIKKFGEGSKSEHDAVYLESTEGSYILRKLGGNPFNDPSLQQLKGKNITAKGMISNYTFLATEIIERKSDEF